MKHKAPWQRKREVGSGSGSGSEYHSPTRVSPRKTELMSCCVPLQNGKYPRQPGAAAVVNRLPRVISRLRFLGTDECRRVRVMQQVTRKAAYFPERRERERAQTLGERRGRDFSRSAPVQAGRVADGQVVGQRRTRRVAK